MKDNKLARWRVIQKLAGHFKVSKKDLLGEIVAPNGDDLKHTEIYASAMLEEQFGFRLRLYCVQGGKVNLKTLLDIRKFKESPIFTSFLNGESLVSESEAPRYVMGLVLSGTVWLIYRESDSYEGVGGIFIRDADSGFAIEPIETFLSYRYPPPC